ncbi:bifunctional hydroxymethylpyrimidine kinase/phosphomethylpyrimidine kinase [Telmatospirillum siberiense]|uniref:hydroxymethylpyrimidine kinase n=1 Tax=Telmatospirillum siberiense TaxID=382514 RepID=A0A2N3Q1Y8_9PROT|nr:bifunctional hydroxymethylpyrimidine kinase/phosphomethylpyrimidine kinase [Telmatospirillum siberiense]PKU26659.1 bifunctional hydroxymethylpyrimidine kinase/phosphomethylpyrimidine kinase [Telmatospirillum siberiense]
MRGRVLIVAGSDSGGGAGIQADIKTVTALGGFAATAITALTAQNTQGVFGVMDVPADFIRSQIDLVLDDIGADVVKTGMLNKPEAIEVIAQALERRSPALPLVLDPVMVAKGGHKLLDDAAHAALSQRLIPKATLVTPNIPEAEALTGMTIRDVDDMVAAGRALLELGPGAVLVKGGHLPGSWLVDVLIDAAGIETFEGVRLETTSTHGTGCTMASAIATGLAQGASVRVAVRRARRYVQLAIVGAPGFGHGHGPLNHAHTVRPFGERT